MEVLQAWPHTPHTGLALACSPAQNSQGPTQNEAILVQAEPCWCQHRGWPGLLSSAGLASLPSTLHICARKNLLAGLGSRGDQQLLGDLTPFLHVLCLGWRWSDHGESKPWPQNGGFYSCTGVFPFPPWGGKAAFTSTALHGTQGCVGLHG